MKYFIKKIHLFLKDILCVLNYFINWIKQYILLFPYNKCFFHPLPFKHGKYTGKTICVFANGPSLRADLNRVLTDTEFENVDFSVMNYFANEPLYMKIKPVVYCLWDPMFYTADGRYNKVMELFEKIEKTTTWKMTLYIRGNIKKFRKYSRIHNPNINIISINAPHIDGSRKLKHFFYRHGWALPYTWTVANVNMFTSVQQGYEYIRLYGADMTLFDGLSVNGKNELCRIVSHFYNDAEENTLQPVYDYGANRVARLSEFVEEVLMMIKGHDEIAEYAASLGIKCLNCCEHSMLDCYPRKQFNN